MRIKDNFSRYILIVYLLGAVLLLYTSYRAAELSITHDEGISYHLVSSNSAWKILNYVIPQDHMLNSLMMKLFCSLLPDNEFVVRLPNLVGHLLYILFSILLLKKWVDPVLLIPGFILLNFNPYLLDFFSIARGYGLSVSLMMMSLYYVSSFIQSRKIGSLFFALFAGCLSVFTVYTMLNYYLALCALIVIILVIWMSQQKFSMNRQAWRIYSLYGLLILLSLVWIYFKLLDPLSRVIGENFIYEEIKSNFYKGTLRPIAFRIIYNQPSEFLVSFISKGVIIIWLISLVVMIKMGIRKNFTFIQKLIFSSTIILGMISLSIYLQNVWLDIRFLNNRTATFLMPLILMPLIGLCDEIVRERFVKIPSLIIIYSISAFFLYNTAIHANFKSYLEWQYDSDTKQMMYDLCDEIENRETKEIHMGIFWLHEPAINFYKSTWGLGWLSKVDRQGYIGDYDYYYVQDADSVMNKDIFKDKIRIKHYESSGMILLKKRVNDE